MRILNLYAGIGGNRKLWGNDHQIDAIEINPSVSAAYKQFWPNDRVIIDDAHQFLIENYRKYDFIWASPPCPTHSDIRRCGVQRGQYDAKYPEMGLYQEIILLKHFSPNNTKWVIENVKPFYDFLIEPSSQINRHCFWTNFSINKQFAIYEYKVRHVKITNNSTVFGFNLKDIKIEGIDKRKVLRNLVNPLIGKYLFDKAIKSKGK